METSSNLIEFEKNVEMAELINTGLDLFGDIEKFKLWLCTPNLGFGNVKPLDMLNDPKNKERVIATLVRASHGIFI